MWGQRAGIVAIYLQDSEEVSPIQIVNQVLKRSQEVIYAILTPHDAGIANNGLSLPAKIGIRLYRAEDGITQVHCARW